MARDHSPPPKTKRARVASGKFARAVLLAVVGVGASAWAFGEWLTTPRRPMFVPIPDAGSKASAWDDAAVIPAPDLELAPR